MPDPINSKDPAPIKTMTEAFAEAKLDAMLGIGTFLTAEEMFLFAQVQLQNTDAEIALHITDITAKKEKAAALQKISAGLRQVKNAPKEQQQQKINELIKDAEATGATEILGKLNNWKKIIDENTGGSGATTPEAIEGYAQDVDAMVTELTSSTELTMIKIQGLMQHRTQMLQLVSNVIAALNEPAKNAISNIRG